MGDWKKAIYAAALKAAGLDAAGSEATDQPASVSAAGGRQLHDFNTRERQPGYSDVFRAGRNAGFDVIDARQYHRNNDGTQGFVEQTMATPWFYKNMPLIGYADIDVRRHGANKYGLYETDVCELWALQESGQCLFLDDIRQPGDPDYVVDAQGRQMRIERALGKLSEFAGASAEYPHVFMHDEWMESRSYINGRMGLPKPTTEEYEQSYLPFIKMQLADPSVILVGRVTRPEDIHIAYESSPNFQTNVDTFHQETEASQPQSFEDSWLDM